MLLALSSLVGGASARGADLPVAAALEVDRRVAPLAVDADAPRFSWRMVDADRGALQSAYRLLVATREDLLDADVGDLFDSGKVLTRRTSYVWDGAALPGDETLFWKVRLWDDADAVGPWSEPQTFGTGPTAEQWSAHWIWDDSVAPNDYCYLRKRFEVAAPILQARAYVSAHDDYVLYVNGVEVGRGPAQTDPYRSGLYDAYDLAPYLTVGTNVIAARAHFHGAYSGSGLGAEPGFLLQARVGIEPLRVGPEGLNLVSDATWRVLADTPFDETSPFRGPLDAQATQAKVFDARLEPTGWRDLSFDDSAWAPATVVTPAFELSAQSVPAQRTKELLAPVSVQEVAPSVWLVDFGTLRSGWPRLEPAAALPGGTTVDVFYSQELAGGRIVRDRDGVTNLWDRWITAGTPGEAFEPDVKFGGFRYLEIEGLASLTEDEVRLRVRTSLDPPVGSFACSDPTLEAVWALSERTLENCVQGVLIDGPQRDQSQFAAEAFVTSFNLLTTHEDRNHVRKMLSDLADSELATGVLRSRYPSTLDAVVPEAALLWVQAVWSQHLLADDERTLAEHYPLARDLVLALDAYRDPVTNTVVDLPFEVDDWLGLDTTGAARTPVNCLLYAGLRRTAEMAAELDLVNDAVDLLVRAVELREGINQTLFDGVRSYRDSTGSESYRCASSVLALATGVVPTEDREAVLAYVETFPTGPAAPIASSYYFQTLVEHGRAEKLHEVLKTEGALWNAMLAAGATTTWEDFTPDRSRCHAGTSFPIAFFPRGIVGIQATSPGHATFDVRPLLGPLAWASAEVWTPHGPIRATCRRSSASRSVELEVPPNTRARVLFDVTGSSSFRVREGTTTIYEDGTFLGGVDGVALGLADPGTLAIELGAGAYLLRVNPTVETDATTLPTTGLRPRRR